MSALYGYHFIFFQENEQMTERHHETPSKKGLLPFTYTEHVLFLQSPVASVVTRDQNPPHSEVLPIPPIYNLQRVFLYIHLEIP